MLHINQKNENISFLPWNHFKILFFIPSSGKFLLFLKGAVPIPSAVSQFSFPDHTLIYCGFWNIMDFRYNNITCMGKINIVSCILYSKSGAANSNILWNPGVLQLKANRVLDKLGKSSLFITQSSGSHSKGRTFLYRFNYSNPLISKCVSWKHLPETRNPFCTLIH